MAVVAGLAGLGSSWLRTLAPTGVTLERGAEGRPTRRFEAPTLRVIAPLLLLYLAVSSLTPLDGLGVAWSGTVALVPEGRGLGGSVIFRSLEHIGAFTLTGYVIAEYRGRSLDRLRTIAPSVLVWAAALSGLIQLTRGWHGGYGASALMFALTLIASLIGGWLYLLQLDHVRALVRPAGTGAA